VADFRKLAKSDKELARFEGFLGSMGPHEEVSAPLAQFSEQMKQKYRHLIEKQK